MSTIAPGETAGSLPLRREIVTLALLVTGSLSVLLGLSVVWKSEGWPLNHEGVTWAARIRVTAAALSQGDPLPVWYREGAAGLGEAMPLFYHKLFNFAAAVFYLGVGSFKTSMCLTLFLFGLLGIVGLYRTCRLLGLGPLLSVVVSATFPHLNYAVTDWMVRGAVAEYAAFSLCTWVIWWSVRLLTERRFGPSIGPILVLVFLAHSVIAYYALATLLIAYLTFCLSHPGEIRATILPALLAMATFLAVVVPLLVLIVRAGAEANLSYLHMYIPTEQYQPLHKYVFDKQYQWGKTYDSYTVQLDSCFLLGCLFFAGWLLLKRARSPLPSGTDAAESRRPRLHTCLLFFAVTFTLYFLLQTRVSAPFYRHIPGASFLQFPWRLLCFLSPLLVCLFVGLSRRVAVVHGRLATCVLLLVSAGTIGLNTARTFSYPCYTRADIENPYVSTWQEYWPVRHAEGQRAGVEMADLRNYAARGIEVLDGRGCRIEEVESAGYMERLYEVRCTAPSVVAVPVAYSGMESLRAESEAGHETIVGFRTAEDPRIRFVAPAGEYHLRLGLPTAVRAFKALLGS